MLVPVHLNEDVEAFFESVAICGEADDGQDDAARGVIGADSKDFGDESRIDVVSRSGTSVAGKDGEV